MNTSTSPSREFWFGVRAELPILLGVIPFGLIYGISLSAPGSAPLMHRPCPPWFLPVLPSL